MDDERENTESLNDTLTQIEYDVKKIYENKNVSNISDEILSADHQVDQDLEYSVPCWDCGTTYKTNMGLKLHIQNKHEGRQYSCDQCNYTASQQGHLKRHKRSIHDKVKHSCGHCDFQASAKEILKRHIESLHLGVSFPCDQCRFETKRRYLLTKHKESMHNKTWTSVSKEHFRVLDLL